jgi:hypothetical protein
MKMRYPARDHGRPYGKERRVLAKVTSCALIGLDGVPITVEVDVGAGMPAFNSMGTEHPRDGCSSMN